MKKILLGSVVSLILMFAISLGEIQHLLNFKIITIFLIGVIGSYYQADYSPFKINNNEVDKGTVLHIIWTVYLTQGLALAEAFHLNTNNFNLITPISIIYLLIALFGLWFRSWAYVTLGKFFTMHLEVQSGHKVIENGPYKYIRHPSYTGAFLTYLFLPLFLGSYYSAAVSILLLTWAFVRRINHEEKMLLLELGADYKEFCAKRNRLLPWIW